MTPCRREEHTEVVLRVGRHVERLAAGAGECQPQHLAERVDGAAHVADRLRPEPDREVERADRVVQFAGQPQALRQHLLEFRQPGDRVAFPYLRDGVATACFERAIGRPVAKGGARQVARAPRRFQRAAHMHVQHRLDQHHQASMT